MALPQWLRRSIMAAIVAIAFIPVFLPTPVHAAAWDPGQPEIEIVILEPGTIHPVTGVLRSRRQFMIEWQTKEGLRNMELCYVEVLTHVHACGKVFGEPGAPPSGKGGSFPLWALRLPQGTYMLYAQATRPNDLPVVSQPILWQQIF